MMIESLDQSYADKIRVGPSGPSGPILLYEQVYTICLCYKTYRNPTERVCQKYLGFMDHLDQANVYAGLLVVQGNIVVQVSWTTLEVYHILG
jgi:hypothetical protein